MSLRIVWFLFCLSPLVSMGQTKTNKRFWFDYNPSFSLSTKLTVLADVGWRKNFNSVNQKFRTVLRPKFKYFIKDHWELLGGMGWFYIVNDNETPDLNEIRPFIGTKVSWPRFDKIAIDHLFRIENRRLRPIGSPLESFLRYRYRIGSTFRYRHDTFVAYFFTPFTAEYIFHLDPSVDVEDDSFRFTTGLGYVFDGQWTVESNVMIQSRGDLATGNLNRSDLVFRLRVFHKIQ